MELEKKTLKKRKKEKKLGIKHYINDKLKGETIEVNSKSITVYPMYVQVIYNGDAIRFRSETNILHYETDLSKLSDESFLKIQYEEEKIRYCFGCYLQEPREDSLYNMLARYGYDYLTELTEPLYNILMSRLSVMFESYENALIKNIKKGELFNENFEYLISINAEININRLFMHKGIGFNDIFELYEDQVPVISEFKNMHSPKFWYFEIYYQNLKMNVETQIPMFLGNIPQYTIYEFSNGSFQREFLNFYKDSITARAIISDLEAIF